MWELDVRIEVIMEPLIIHLGESDDDWINWKNWKMRVDFLNP
jgi:hypothetical protein